jgi:hypothetical protein
MNQEIKDLLATAQASARMIAEDRSTDLLDDGKTGDAAYDAIIDSEKYGSAVAAAKADAAAEAWINSNEAIARRLIQRRIDIRAARAARA